MYKSKSKKSKKQSAVNILTALAIIAILVYFIVGNITTSYVTVYRGFDYNIVYDKETMVMYSISKRPHSKGVVTAMLNADGTPKLWDGEISETN